MNVSDCKSPAEIEYLLKNVMFDFRLRYRDMQNIDQVKDNKSPLLLREQLIDTF
jgi:hypothetical protein